MHETRVLDISVITNDKRTPSAAPEFLSETAVANVRRIHSEFPAYVPTPLADMKSMADRLGIRAFFVKDESKRFGLNAFKGLGGLYVTACVAARELGLDAGTVRFDDLMKPEYRDRVRQMVFITTTDGNHGRGISWACGQLGCEAHIYMPMGSSERRAQAIRDVNPRAEVTVTDMGYDDTVRYTAALAKEKGWYLVQDTSWDGYEDIPALIIQGYTTMVAEACDELDRRGLKPTHVFLQAGVGSMAGAAAGYLANRYKDGCPRIGIVEPESMACFYESTRVNDGLPHPAADQGPTIMAGLSCGEACTVIWPVLRDLSEWFVKCPDSVTEYGMRLLAAGKDGDPAVVSGESGAVTTGLVNTALLPGYAGLKELFGLDGNSVVLCFSTEGNTDPETYSSIVCGIK